MNVLEEYERGVDSYWAGDIPSGWDGRFHTAEFRDAVFNQPYLAGWHQSSLADNGGL